MKDEKTQTQERSYELRSEKVRSIVGYVPPVLTRYGISIIAIGAVLLFIISAFIPYQQVYTGSVVWHGTPLPTGDTVAVSLFLTFEGKRIGDGERGASIELQPLEGVVRGRLQQLSSKRDTSNRQEAIILFNRKELQAIAPQTMDFRLVVSKGSLLTSVLRFF